MADLAHATENDNDLHGDQDALHWAERFASRFRVSRLPSPDTSFVDDTEGLMLAWFAGAIETGKMQPVSGHVLEDKIREAVFQALGAASTCWIPGTGDAEFDSSRARDIGEELLVEIKRFAECYRAEFPGDSTR